jgi:hypothetical protein
VFFPWYKRPSFTLMQYHRKIMQRLFWDIRRENEIFWTQWQQALPNSIYSLISSTNPNVICSCFSQIFNLPDNFEESIKKLNSVGLVGEQTIPTERPTLVGKVNAKLLRIKGVAWSTQRIPHDSVLGFLDQLKDLLALFMCCVNLSVVYKFQLLLKVHPVINYWRDSLEQCL